MTLEQAVATFVLMLVAQIPIVVAAVVSYLKNKAAIKESANKVDEVVNKIEENTTITRAGATAAVASARVAANCAAEAKTASEDLSRQFNGALDERITKIVQTYFEPLRDEVKAHAAADEKNMAELRATLSDIKRVGFAAVTTDEDLMKILAKKYGRTAEQVRAALGAE